MKHSEWRLPIVIGTLILFIGLAKPSVSKPVLSRDHLTPEEVDLVKEAQLIDLRIGVFDRAIERRMIVLTNAQGTNTKDIQKESEKWGALPTGTQAELLGDIAGILDEAITNIDDIAEREDANAKLMHKALRMLAAESNHLIERLKPMDEKLEEGPAKEALEQALDNASSILEAAGKLPPDESDTKDSKKKKSQANPIHGERYSENSFLNEQ